MELSIDTAGDMASVALSQEGELLAETTWRCRRNHQAELMPTAVGLMERLGARKEDLKAVFVSTGPGGYMGLRVGVSAAKGLAFALGIDLVGVPRLEADAYQQAAHPGPICPVHQAGRGAGPATLVAWAIYEGGPAGCREALPPSLTNLGELIERAPAGCLFCGDMPEELAAALRKARPGAPVVRAVRRAGALAELGWQRLLAGRLDDPASLKPIYLREPAIGPAEAPP
ncbi:MAG TPA: tRNA (adenosine(37)-N6)-threonylcarbamoyltransferase complex dimerization subunit type 1 TsaB [Dehalococcoidia bacterium]|nr:tRNA (adenosine(37)-N6)-threonylcarbamoyltransferase complex dimerization subunit type 1 TsaB [Dehalococcoidia bacterium]